MKWEDIKLKVRPRFLSRGTCTVEQLKSKLDTTGLYYREFLDLVVGYVILSDYEKPFENSTEIYIDMMKEWGIEGCALHNQALDNMELDEYGIYYGADSEDCEPHKVSSMSECEMGMLTNKYIRYGAISIINKNLCTKILGNAKYIVLPISVNELGILKYNDCYDVSEINHTIVQANSDVIAPDDILSDGAYIWENGNVERWV